MRLASCVLLALTLAASPVAAAASADNCAIGSYGLVGGGMVDVGPSGEDGLRWRRPDGTSGALSKAADGRWDSSFGWTGRSDGKRVGFDCKAGTIDFAGVHGKRIAFDVTETRFEVQGAELAGRLVMPKGEHAVPVVVLVHGAEPSSARDLYALQRMFPAAGIGAFVYDKRGTGASGGRYTHDYLMLAVDAIAAAHEARRLAGERALSIGYQAGSQGGWVAPLASKIEGVDFVIVGFGLAVSPLAGERESLALDVARHGYGADVLKKAMELADAIDAVVASDFKEGYDKLAAIRQKYAGEPWMKDVRGSFSGFILDTPPEKMKLLGPTLIPSVPFAYDPMPVLQGLETPQLWILAADDRDAPSAETARRLADLAKAGRPITAAVFPGVEHGMYAYETKPDGTRVSTRAPAGYFPMMRDFILKGAIAGDYGARIVARNAAQTARTR